MAATGSTFKTCGCRDETGRLLRKRCPKLRRGNGRWSSTHGTWNYQIELPPTADGARRGPLRRAGFPTQDAAEAEMTKVKELLAIAGDDQQTAVQIADLIVTTVRETKTLPDPHLVRLKVRVGQDLSRQVTVGEYLERWLAGRRGLRETTRRSYANHIKLYFIPHLGHIPLDKLRVPDVERIFDAIDELNEAITRARESSDPQLRAKVKGRRVINAATKQRIRATLRAALNRAIKERLIEVNVASLIELPSGKAPKALVWTDERIIQWRKDLAAHTERMDARRRRMSELEPHKRIGDRINRLDAYIGATRPSRVMVWTPALTKRFLDRARQHRLYALFHLIAFRGLRRGEACGLRWSDLDLKNGAVTIRWQITQIGSETFEGKPKSEAGEATISLDASTIKELRAHKARQSTERFAAGDAWAETGYVFTTETGGLVNPNEVTEQFEHLSMEAGLPPVRLHDLRHGAASFLLAAGYDLKVVQETLRLSSITIAADIYTSLLPQLARKSAEDAAAIILNADTGDRPKHRGRAVVLMPR
ncbi:Phage integrase, N-terminal SAM-like domain [Thermomonospora echinospora]|uniref:Phage integrase, N-terminal SAM-like domain n=1 Tax=Thermomonospora echinospora TaxID=1992 RepID=A0A1H6D0W4_9ACTN|nr:tyrosine-type recombinase/integrase [Thermomonospora echinospora]SEG79039.1 Phage integrase, N-terminal SAM-like domain [Thermomonospora echinospora]